MKLKVTASPRGGVGSNRRRTDSPQGNEPGSAACSGEPARVERSLDLATSPIGRAEVTEKATSGRTTWLGVGCPEGKRSKRRDLLGVRAPGRSQSPHSTAAALSREKRGKQNRAEGRWVGRWKREGQIEARASTGSARKGYTRCRSRKRPCLVVGGSFGMDGAHGVGAGQRRQRRTLVQFAGQGVCACHASGGLGESPGPMGVQRAWMVKALNGSKGGQSSI